MQKNTKKLIGGISLIVIISLIGIIFTFQNKNQANQKVIDYKQEEISNQKIKENQEKFTNKFSKFENYRLYKSDTRINKKLEEWEGNFVFEDKSSRITLKVLSDVIYFYGRDPFGIMFKIECVGINNGNELLIYSNRIMEDNVGMDKKIVDSEYPIYILSYKGKTLYTQTQFDSDGLEGSYIYFIRK